MTILYGAKRIRQDGNFPFLGMDLPPSMEEGVIPDESRVLIGEIYGIVPYITLETGEEKAVVKVYGVPVVAGDIERGEDGRILGFSGLLTKPEKVLKTYEALQREETTERVVAGLVYGFVHYPEPEVFVKVFGNVNPRGIVLQHLKGKRELLSELGMLKRRMFENGDINYEVILKAQWLIAKGVEENREDIGKTIKKGVFVDVEDRFILRNNPDVPKVGEGFVAIYVGSERIITTGTPVYDMIRRAVAIQLSGMSFEDMLKDKKLFNKSERAILENLGQEFFDKTKNPYLIKFMSAGKIIVNAEAREDANTSQIIAEEMRRVYKDFKLEIPNEQQKQALAFFAHLGEVLANGEHLRYEEAIDVVAEEKVEVEVEELAQPEVKSEIEEVSIAIEEIEVEAEKEEVVESRMESFPSLKRVSLLETMKKLVGEIDTEIKEEPVKRKRKARF